MAVRSYKFNVDGQSPLRHPNRFIVFLAAPNYTKQASNAYRKPFGTLLMCLEPLSHWVPLSRAVKMPSPCPMPCLPQASFTSIGAF